jgi:mannose-6-phosphate isomerase-like protein (cupin superfamily)
LDDKTIVLEKNESIYIPKGAIHRVKNIGEKNLKILETQFGSRILESDIIRYDDDFDRIKIYR